MSGSAFGPARRGMADMFDLLGKALFKAIRDAARLRLGEDHPCLTVLDQAIKADDPSSARSVQDALSALDPGVMAALMADVHKALRESPDALLSAWPADRARH